MWAFGSASSRRWLPWRPGMPAWLGQGLRLKDACGAAWRRWPAAILDPKAPAQPQEDMAGTEKRRFQPNRKAGRQRHPYRVSKGLRPLVGPGQSPGRRRHGQLRAVLPGIQKSWTASAPVSGFQRARPLVGPGRSPGRRRHGQLRAVRPGIQKKLDRVGTRIGFPKGPALWWVQGKALAAGGMARYALCGLRSGGVASAFSMATASASGSTV
jgi:hypothetical protein